MDPLDRVQELLSAGKLQREIASIMGISRSRVANLARTLALPSNVLALVRSGRLSHKHGELLAGIKDRSLQRRLAEEAAARRWPISRLRAELDSAKGKRGWSDASPDADIASLERKLGELLGTTVQIEKGAGSGGALRLFYADLDTLSGLLERLGFTE
ncbi:hypothetical protein [uncultured Stenotrophomonas sp.]|uniref:ParB/RepB/Spo0J family partition protein n=1 Tax=uncultured Stenotrophomonas sp. TaxID=165438 RepID=UPI0025EC05EE|nr:hypothetical protein [uncultured Stenotrophomonas sp.]